MARKTRVDSVKGMMEIMANAAKGPPKLPPHLKLRPQDQPFYDTIIQARSHDEWGGADLALAVQLAKVQADIDVQQAALDVEAHVIEMPPNGKLSANPRFLIIENMVRRQNALMRTLKMNGCMVGDARGQVARRKADRLAHELRNEMSEASEDEDLLA